METAQPSFLKQACYPGNMAGPLPLGTTLALELTGKAHAHVR